MTGTTLTWTNHSDGLDWADMETLYRLAPLGQKSADHLRTVFGNSRYQWFVRDAGRLVGAGRALADGADCAYLCDIAVLPSHQGLGLGRQIVERLLDDARGHQKLILYSVPGKEGFYRKFGFLRMRTAMAVFRDPAAAIRRGHLAED